MSYKTNFIKRTDSYKPSHHLMYPANTTRLFAYLESRVGSEYSKTVFFGLQYLLKEYLTHRVTREEVEEAQVFFKAHGVPFPYDGWMKVVTEHDGKLPVRISAVEEGSVIPINNVLLTVENTDKELYWIVTWIETMIMRLWYPITVATLSWTCKKVILKYLLQTSNTSQEAIAAAQFMLHDFGARGVSSAESAGIGGMAHLVNFMGSDTDEGIDFANHYYNILMAGFSIPASEHSIPLSFGGKEHEVDYYRQVLNTFAKPGAIVAMVADTYDLFNAIENIIGGELHDQIVNSGAVIVVRPDSGHPPTIVTQCLQLLDRQFGSTVNDKGFKILNHVKVIQGDGNDNEASIEEILKAATDAGYAAQNLAFGMGGGLLQKVNRDTQRFAFKVSEVTVDGHTFGTSKDPATDHTKKSKKGHLDLMRNEDGTYLTVNETYDAPYKSALVPVFENGEILKEYTFEEIRDRAQAAILKEMQVEIHA